MVICLERGAALHMAQLMPLPLTVSCFSKIQIGFTFLVPAHLGSPGQRAIKRVCVCVCACARALTHTHTRACVRACVKSAKPWGPNQDSDTNLCIPSPRKSVKLNPVLTIKAASASTVHYQKQP